MTTSYSYAYADTFITGISVYYDDDNYVYVNEAELSLDHDIEDTTFSYTNSGDPVFYNSDAEYADLEFDLESAYLDEINLLSEPYLDATFVDIHWGNSKVSTVAMIFLGDELFMFELGGKPINIESASDWIAFSDSITLITAATGEFAAGEDIAWSEFSDSWTRTVITGTSGDDIIQTTEFRDSVYGESGNDVIINNANGHYYDGGAGDHDEVSFQNDPGSVNASLNDTFSYDGNGETIYITKVENLVGSAFDDTLQGSRTNNVLIGLKGKDIISGGGGIDQVRYDRDVDFGGTTGVTVALEKGVAFDGFGDKDTLSDITDVYGSIHGDDISGSMENNTLEGDAGDDTLRGLKGDDILWGGDGDDRLEGGNGIDTMDGGSGDDTLLGGKGADVIEGGIGADTLTGGAGNDKLSGGDDEDHMNGGGGSDKMKGGKASDIMLGGKSGDELLGGGGSDEIEGGQGKDILFGEGGKDVLNGGGNDDTLYGGEGHDALLGGNGADILNGDANNDTLKGGGGGDTFVFAGEFGHDVITDFNSGKDGEVIDLIDAAGIQDFNDLSKNHLSENSDGDAVITDKLGNTITLENVSITELSADDFLL